MTDPKIAFPNLIFLNKILFWSSQKDEQFSPEKLLPILNEFWIRIQRIFCGYNLIRNSLEILGTSDFVETGLTSSLLHFIAKENEFPAKEDQKIEFPLKLEFGLISQ